MSTLIEFPNLSIESPQSSDIEIVADLVNQIWHETYDAHLPPDICAERVPAVFADIFKSRMNTSSIARLGTSIIGYADTVSNVIDNLWVDERYRRRGIGSKLLQAQLEKLKAKGLQSAQAGCETFNKSAIGFFENHDWQVLDETVEAIATGVNIGVIVYGKRF
jgi:GNAT superfamily N-acetyltransferase